MYNKIMISTISFTPDYAVYIITFSTKD